MTEEIKMRDVLKYAFKETPKSFRNMVNNAIAEAVQFKHRAKKAVKNQKRINDDKQRG